MIAKALTGVKDFLYAQLCYQLFITPMPLKLEQEYRDFARRACEFITTQRSEIIHVDSPRHHVIHHFSQPNNPNAKKVLITHGWMSRAAYMVKLIRTLHKQGYDVYALDFPAHGEARGLQLTWIESVTILRNILNQSGPFYAVMGHSFGGSMLLNTLNLAGQFPEWQLNALPERAVLIASPTSLPTLISKLARRFNLSRQSYILLRDTIRQSSTPNIKHLNFRHLVNHSSLPILCIHGKNDDTILPKESIHFCRHYPHASLALLPDIDHVGVLIDSRVETMVCNFLL